MKIGDIIIEFDLVLFEEKVKLILIFVVIFNMDEIKELNKFFGLVIVGEILILCVIK